MARIRDGRCDAFIHDAGLRIRRCGNAAMKRGRGRCAIHRDRDSYASVPAEWIPRSELLKRIADVLRRSGVDDAEILIRNLELQTVKDAEGRAPPAPLPPPPIVPRDRRPMPAVVYLEFATGELLTFNPRPDQPRVVIPRLPAGAREARAVYSDDAVHNATVAYEQHHFVRPREPQMRRSSAYERDLEVWTEVPA